MIIFLILNSQFELILALSLSLFHEIGHIISIKLFKISIMQIKITPFSFDILYDHSLVSYKKEIIILLCGPIFNLFLSILFFLLNIIYNQYLLKLLFYQNIIIGFTNLFPISSLDGGRLLLILLYKNFSERTSNQLSFIVSIIFIIPIMCSGFLILIKSNFNMSALLLSIYLSYFLIFQKWDNKKYNCI